MNLLQPKLPILLAALAFGLASCSSIGRTIPRHTDLFAQYSIRFERDEVQATNYRRGRVLPVNSVVRFLDMNRVQGKLQVVSAEGIPSGTILRFTNIEKHTGLTLELAFHRAFGLEPVEMDGFSEEEIRAIERGRVEIGMSKAAVLASLGEPPMSLTSSTDMQRWTYPQGRISKIRVYFDKNSRVEKIR